MYMNDKYIVDVLNEIDEKYIDEAVKFQHKKKKRSNKYLIPLVASISLILVVGAFLYSNHMPNKKTLESLDYPSINSHSFALMVYAAEDSKMEMKEIPMESHEYIISSEDGTTANRFYRLVSVDGMPEEMKSRIDLSEELVMCYGFNMRIEGEGIDSITYEALDTEFVKKIDYSWNEDMELFEKYPECLGISSKENFNGSNGKEYKNCGNTEIRHWLFTPVGKKYTVSYEEQGSLENLYALKLSYDRKKIVEAAEYSRLNTEDNYHTINDELIKAILGQKIKVKVNYADGCSEEMVIEITHVGGMCMKVQVYELTVNCNSF